MEKVFARPLSVRNQERFDAGFSYYEANCPSDFVDMGTLVSTNSYAGPDDFPEFRCLHYSLTKPSERKPGGGVWIKDSEYFKYSESLYKFREALPIKD